MFKGLSDYTNGVKWCFFFHAIFESNIVTQRFQYFIIRFEIKTFCNKEPLFNSFIR